ncbi:hypothetical protein L6452_21124 [Arctium lappa]|uniref:Uncharacterized protein n=1 Tax=Arctium lappa TaxID=4217 RepID=A0ACB9BEJ6_ARCLA|nr:hypothetical protein L6452_21124 [Arctium lappa]
MENKRGVDEMKLERGRRGFGIDGEDNRSTCGEVLCGIDGFPYVECYGVLVASFTFQISFLLLWLSAMERTAGMNYKDGTMAIQKLLGELERPKSDYDGNQGFTLWGC